MSISTSTLNAIQKVGAAAFTADDKLKKEVQSYAERVNLAMLKNPYNLGNDALIEAWKVVARLAKSMMGIEEELKNIHRIASELTQDDQPSVRETPALAAPVVKQKKAKKVDEAVTTVKVKGKRAAAVKAVAAATPVADTAKTPAKRRVAKKTDQLPVATPVKVAPVKTVAKKVTAPKAKKNKTASTPVQTQELKGNSAKLMVQLQAMLNEADFTDINQSAVAKAAGIPLGSIGATIARLVKAGWIVMGANGSLKLAVAVVAATPAIKAEAQPNAPVPAESAIQA